MLFPQLALVEPHTAGQSLGNRHTPQRHAELRNQARDLCLVVVQDDMSGKLCGFARGTRSHERVAVAVAADPGPEIQDLGEMDLARLPAVDVGQRAFQLGVEAWKGLKQRSEER